MIVLLSSPVAGYAVFSLSRREREGGAQRRKGEGSTLRWDKR
jgi:hypothetical protein